MKVYKTLEWFINHINMAIYRKSVPDRCLCPSCGQTINQGVFILDLGHAEYLFNLQFDLELEYSDFTDIPF